MDTHTRTELENVYILSIHDANAMALTPSIEKAPAFKLVVEAMALWHTGT